ncbi:MULTISPECIES: site-specific integrase [Vibrio]|nr:MULTISPECIES: site-specific integrase [Vibrio]MBO0246358.1 site-specific integrase [Vibrio sp. Vb0592]MDW1736677.1 site-specific integrase [Vibrio sp. Vb2235]MDW1788955.1 site-specific integrase [Vibrio sp. Vb2227]MDW1818587.1 site-specific integrase [Vibrio sp. Vb2232]MDW1868268.1 site-specific integrase [Vibrio sp. Vb1127]
MALKQKITNTSIKNLKIDDKRLNDTEISGFHARISPKGIIKYYFYYRLNGKQRNYLLGAANSLTPAQARDLAKEKAGLVAGGKDVQETRFEAKREALRKTLTLERFLDEHYESYLLALNPKTAKQSFMCIKSNFKHLAHKPMSEITAWDVQQWVSEKRKLGRASSTISYAYNRLKAAFNRAVEWDFIDSHTLSSVKIVKEDDQRIRYLSKIEEAALLDSLKARDVRMRENQKQAHRQEVPKLRYVDYLEPLIVMAMNTGMRKGEMLTLCWEHVNFENRYLTITSENAKSKKRRTIPLNDTVFSMLNDWKAQNYSEESELVFTSNGKPIDTYQYQWEQLLKDANIHNFRFHDLRHHFASKLVMAAVDLNTVRELLGHADLKMTLRYAHLAPEHKASAVNLIG